MNHSHFKSITAEMAALYEAKNADYADSFSKSIAEFGYTAALVRIFDKFNRARNLLTNNNAMVNSESVSDTLTDLANYAVMLRMAVEDINAADL